MNHPDSFLDQLIRLVETLRGPHGCPWDKKQTPRNVILYLLEEAYELADAVETESSGQIREELGDVLFHVAFMARIFQERGEFDLEDVACSITEKMIRRHPHVFGGQTVKSSEEVVQNWHQIKLDEKKADRKGSLLDSVPLTLPALMRAYRISDRAAKSGLDWVDIDSALKKVKKALDDFGSALESQDNNLLSQEIGDLLFAMVTFTRMVNIHPETALAGSVKRFEKRFRKMEAVVSETERTFEDVSREEKALIWEMVKKTSGG